MSMAQAIGRELERWGHEPVASSVLELCAARALETLLSDEVVAAMARAQYAAEREIPIDPEMYANRLVEDEYTRFAAIGLRAAIHAALPADEAA